MAVLEVYLGTASVDVKGAGSRSRGENDAMGAKEFDVVAIGNAIVDVIARADDGFLAAQGIDKDDPTDEARATALTKQPAIESLAARPPTPSPA